MPKSQIADMLTFDGTKVAGKGTLERSPGEVMKTFWVRVCQPEHAHHPTGASVNLAEGHFNGDSSSVFRPDGTWELDLPMLQGSFVEGAAAASAVLVFEDGGDLFTLAWAECVHLER